MACETNYTWQDYVYMSFLCVVMVLFCVLLSVMIYRHWRGNSHHRHLNPDGTKPHID